MVWTHVEYRVRTCNDIEWSRRSFSQKGVRLAFINERIDNVTFIQCSTCSYSLLVVHRLGESEVNANKQNNFYGIPYLEVGGV